MSERFNCIKTASLLDINLSQVNAVVNLLAEGGTVPFIARYRKELTGGLDEVQIAKVRDEMERLQTLDKRRETILASIEEQGKLTDDLKSAIENAETLSKLEDIYLPYKPKRRTKATIAREKGLEPLAQLIFEQGNFDVETEASKYVNSENQVADVADALQGAKDIIAEWINENAAAREKLRHLFKENATIKSRVLRGKEEEGEKFKDYFDWEEKLSAAPSHRVLAMRRGENEGILALDISPDADDALDLLETHFIKANNNAAALVKQAIANAYNKMLQLSIETEMRLLSKQMADEKAIIVFADNLRELLLASPLGQKAILAIDPGFRTGCKIVALNKQGKLLANSVIYPHEPQRNKREAERVINDFIVNHKLEAIAIGNGTAGRETEDFIRSLNSIPKEIITVMVNESGASIYSASELAREEFPDEDLTVRGAVSIGRRLADPLAELVKLDAKSIGVGQYQHDVDQVLLKRKLDEVVESCVNAVGVEVNTASKQLLTYVSGLGSQLAQNIVQYRNENGAFKSRKELMKVPRMGDKAFEQAAGFLRVLNAKHPLDASAVHPESYAIVEQMATDLNCKIEDIIQQKELRKRIDAKKYVTEKVGLPTLTDILKELEKPGRDPRKVFEAFKFTDGVNSIDDLREGMKLPGIVTNVTNFGAFVDIGVHQDGLVHISQLSNTFVDDPNKVVKVQQHVMVTVTEVDAKRKRIALSMKDNPQVAATNNKQTKKETPDTTTDWQKKLAALKGKL